MKTKVAILGGSFNPPHICHVLAASWALSTCGIDEVWLVPVAQHAFGKNLADFASRMEMTRLAFAHLKGVKVSDIEARLGGENRTIDTLDHLAAEHPQHSFSIVVGSDILLETHAWKAWDRIVSDYGVHVLGRSGVTTDRHFDITLPDVSSSAIRAQVEKGRLDTLDALLPHAVLDYIRQHNLYGVGP